MKYLIGADIGTTSLKAGLFDENGAMLRTVTKEYALDVKGDRVEMNPEVYFQMFEEAYAELADGYEIAAFAIDTQCETMIVTDEAGKPLYPAIVWLDNRATAEADEIKAAFGCETVYNVTGQPEITATWPAAKLMWLRKHEPEVFAGIKRIFLLEDYILYRATGAFVTEATLQSSSLYLDIRQMKWWGEMLSFIGITEAQLPQIQPTSTVVGTYKGAAAVTGAMDQIAGAMGAGVIGSGTISEMTGTTMAIFAPTGEIPAYNPASIIPCHVNYDGGYCLLSWTPTAGIALRWFKDTFCPDLSFKEIDDLAASTPPGAAGVQFLPFLCGSTMPKYDPTARGAFLGMTMEHTRAHLSRAVLESVACLLRENLEYMGCEATEIRSMGGGSSSPLWCQMKADVTGRKIVTLENKETACLGSAFYAGLGVGIWKDPADCAKVVRVKKEYAPSGAEYEEAYRAYVAAENKMLG